MGPALVCAGAAQEWGVVAVLRGRRLAWGLLQGPGGLLVCVWLGCLEFLVSRGGTVFCDLIRAGPGPLSQHCPSPGAGGECSF